MIDVEEFVQPPQVTAPDGFLAECQPDPPGRFAQQCSLDAGRGGGCQQGVPADGEEGGVVGRKERAVGRAAHGFRRPAAGGLEVGERDGGFAERRRGVGQRQVVADGCGLGHQAAQGVSVVERGAGRKELFPAVGSQLEAHESRDGAGIALGGGKCLDAGGEVFRAGHVAAAEERARSGVEQGDVCRDVAGPAAGDVDRLV